MKKLFLLLILFAYAHAQEANVYFDYPVNSSTYYSGTSGTAGVNYYIHTVSLYFIVDEYAARINYPNGSWGSWQIGQSGGWALTKAGTYLIEGGVHVRGDAGGGSNYFMYSNILTFYVVDNNAPAIPQNLSVTSYNGHPKLQWNANTESDLEKYVIYKKESEEVGYQYCGETTSILFVDGTESSQGNCPCHLAYYKIKAVDINANA